MRSRDEVLTVDAINDRIRELEAQQAASEPVACPRWGTCFSHDCTCHPSAAAVTITDAMVEAAARAFYGAFYDGDRLWSGCPEDIRVWWMDAGRDALDAALTAASEGASDAES